MSIKDFKTVRVQSTRGWESTRHEVGSCFDENTRALSTRVVWQKRAHNSLLIERHQPMGDPDYDYFTVQASNGAVEELWLRFLKEEDLDTHEKLGTSAWDLALKFAEFSDRELSYVNLI